MTNIKIQKAGNSLRIEILDHTESTVCAGISALSYMISGWMINHPEDMIDHYFRITSGYYEAGYTAAGEKTEAVMEAAIIGLKQIALGYPEDVKILEIES